MSRRGKGESGRLVPDVMSGRVAVRSRQVLPAIMTTRLLSDTANQMFNPFLAIFAAGIGVSLQQLGVLLSIRSLAGLTGPVFGAMADRYGALPVARFGLMLLAAGLVLLGASTSWLTALLAVLPMGVALGIINPALQAYLGSVIRFERRARALSVAEYSWALAGIVGLLAFGWLISFVGWRGAVFVLAGALVLGQFGLRLLPAQPTAHAVGNGRSVRLPALAWLGSAVVALLFFTMFSAMVVHGAWLTDVFATDARSLGVVALVLGVADLVGAALVSVLGSRVNVAGLASVTSVLCAAAYLWLALTAPVTLAASVALLAVVRFTMQSAFVSVLTLLSEVAPYARGLVMATAAALGQVGMALAALVGPSAYASFGFGSVALISSVGMGVAGLLLVLFRQGFQPRLLASAQAQTGAVDDSERTLT